MGGASTYDGINLQGVDLRQAKGLTKEQLQRARNWVLAYYSDELLDALGLPRNHKERIKKKDLAGYDLRNVSLRGANLQGVNLQGANLRETKGLTKRRLQGARNWVLAYYSGEILQTLGLPHYHNERIENRNLSGYSLRDAHLQGADLKGFDLTDANLQSVNFSGATGLSIEQLQRTRNWVLAYYSDELLDALGLPRDHNERVQKKDFRNTAWLRGANLQGADLKDAQLAGTDLRDSNLQDADLTDAKGILSKQLARANVSNAKLPDSILEFKAVANIEELTKSARKVFTLTLLGCGYAWLTILTTSDANLFTNSSSYPLPIFGNKIPIVWLYWILPLILLASHLDLLSYLQKVWEGLSELPNFLPDGRSIDMASSSWLLVGLVRRHIMTPKDVALSFTRLQLRISIFLVWEFVPLTLLAFYSRALPRHEVLLQSWILLLLASSIFFGFNSYHAARHTLHLQSVERVRDTLVRSLLPILMIILLGGSYFTAWVIYGDRPKVDNPTAKRLIEYFYANFENEELTRGANLSKSNLRYANARNAKMVDVHLQGSDLRGAQFNGANLSNVDLQDANLQDADLRESKGLKTEQLQGARNWVLAYYSEDRLSEFKLPADHNDRIENRDLRNTTLPQVNLHEADLSGINVQNADLRKAKGLTKEQMQRARNWPLALYNREILDAFGFPANHGDRIAKKDLRNYPLQGADLQGADLDAFNLDGANLQEADFREAKRLTKEQLGGARNWALAYYSQDLLSTLGLPISHNPRSKNLRDYSLRGANLQGADLESFDLSGANLQAANLRDANGLTKEQLQRTRNWVLAYYSKELLAKLGLPSDHNERIDRKNLHGYPLLDANLQQADLQAFDLADANLQGANLRDTKGLTKEQLQRAANWVLAYYSQELLPTLGLTSDHNERIDKKDLRKTKLPEANLHGADLKGFKLQETDLSVVKGLTKQQLQDASNWILAYYSPETLTTLGLQRDHNHRIVNKDLSTYSLQNVNLQGAKLQGFNFRNANMQNANITGADLRNANIQEADLRGIKGLLAHPRNKLQEIRNWVLAYYGQDHLNALGLPLDHNERIARKDLGGYSLRDANMQGADLKGFELTDANLQGVNFSGATGLSIEQLQRARNWILAYYSDELLDALGLPRNHNARIKKKDLIGYDLRNVNLRGAKLQGFNLQGANLHETKGLTKRGLQGTRNWVLAYYTEEILPTLGLPHDHNERIANRNLRRYSLKNVNLREADLKGFDLSGADLREADLRDAELEAAELRWTKLSEANLQGANLRGVKGLTRTSCSLTEGLWLFLKCLFLDPEDELRKAKNWGSAYYSKDLLGVLGLPPDHNERIGRKS